MKKLIISTLVLSFMISGMEAFSAMTTDHMTSEEYLRNSGYSPETVRIINLRKKDPYQPVRVKEPDTGKTRMVNWVKKFYQYMDPATDNQRFGEGIIDPRLDRPSQL